MSKDTSTSNSPLASTPNPSTSTSAATGTAATTTSTTTTAGVPAPVPVPAAVTSSTTTPHSNDHLSPSQLRSRLEATRKELRLQLDKKRKVDRELVNLEASIYGFEGSYLSDALLSSTMANGANGVNGANGTNGAGGGGGGGGQAAHFGNIIKGYDAYLKAPSTSTSSTSDRKRSRANEEPRPGDRIFSMSSATYQKAVEMTGGVIAVLSSAPGTTGATKEGVTVKGQQAALDSDEDGERDTTVTAGTASGAAVAGGGTGGAGSSSSAANRKRRR